MKESRKNLCEDVKDTIVNEIVRVNQGTGSKRRGIRKDIGSKFPKIKLNKGMGYKGIKINSNKQIKG